MDDENIQHCISFQMFDIGFVNLVPYNIGPLVNSSSRPSPCLDSLVLASFYPQHYLCSSPLFFLNLLHQLGFYFFLLSNLSHQLYNLWVLDEVRT